MSRTRRMRQTSVSIGIAICCGLLTGCAALMPRVPTEFDLGPKSIPEEVANFTPPRKDCGCRKNAAGPLALASTLASTPAPHPIPEESTRLVPTPRADRVATSASDGSGLRTLLRKTMQGLTGRPLGLRDGAMVRVSGEEERATTREPSTLPVLMRIGMPNPNAGAGPDGMATPPPTIALEYIDPDVRRPAGPTGPETEATPAPPGGMTTETAFNPGPDTRKETRVAPPPRERPADPVRYGPEATYPASYFAPGTAPTSIPKTREIWSNRSPAPKAPVSISTAEPGPQRGPIPAVNPGRPSLMSRIWKRFQRPAPRPASAPAAVPMPRPVSEPASAPAATAEPESEPAPEPATEPEPGSARVEPGNVPEHGQGLVGDGVPADGGGEPTER